MARRAGLATLVMVVGCMMVAARTERGRVGDNDDFDYFVMVVQWPATFCREKGSCCARLQRANFTIHGLWPERFDGGWPSCCNVDEYPYEPEKIKDLQRQLDLDWPSLRCKPPSGCSNPGQGGIRSFHRHEWEKHGTCSIPVFPDIHRYFSAVLALKDSIDVLGALAKADIVPTDNERYTYQQMRDAIAVDVGATPHIDCKNGKLSEVWICLQKYPDSDNEFKVFDCPQSEVKSCPKGQPISIPVRTPFLDNGSQMTSAI